MLFPDFHPLIQQSGYSIVADMTVERLRLPAHEIATELPKCFEIRNEHIEEMRDQPVVFLRSSPAGEKIA